MATYSDWQQRQLDQASAEEMDRLHAMGRPAGMKRSRGQWENMKPGTRSTTSWHMLAEVERLKAELMRRVPQ